jgi:hypothetical protein
MSSSPYRERDIVRLVASVAQSQTDSILKAAVTGRRWRVLAFDAMASDATALTLNSKGSGSGVAISPTWTGATSAAQKVSLPFNPHGWFETVPGEGLSATTGSGQTVGMVITLAAVDSDAGTVILENGENLLLENGNPLLLEAA